MHARGASAGAHGAPCATRTFNLTMLTPFLRPRHRRDGRAVTVAPPTRPPVRSCSPLAALVAYSRVALRCTT